MSKFLPNEFFPYARKFYTNQKNDEAELKWKYAWLHHQHHNKHHWEYWVVNQNSKEALKMPRKYAIEMVCDWRSFSRKWGRKVKESTLPERMMESDKIILHPETRQELLLILSQKAENTPSSQGRR